MTKAYTSNLTRDQEAGRRDDGGQPRHYKGSTLALAASTRLLRFEDPTPPQNKEGGR